MVELEGRKREIETNASVTFADLPSGSYAIKLSGLSINSCESLTGALQVVVATSGGLIRSGRLHGNRRRCSNCVVVGSNPRVVDRAVQRYHGEGF